MKLLQISLLLLSLSLISITCPMENSLSKKFVCTCNHCGQLGKSLLDENLLKYLTSHTINKADHNKSGQNEFFVLHEKYQRPTQQIEALEEFINQEQMIPNKTMVSHSLSLENVAIIKCMPEPVESESQEHSATEIESALPDLLLDQNYYSIIQEENVGDITSAKSKKRKSNYIRKPSLCTVCGFNYYDVIRHEINVHILRDYAHYCMHPNCTKQFAAWPSSLYSHHKEIHGCTVVQCEPCREIYQKKSKALAVIVGLYRGSRDNQNEINELINQLPYISIGFTKKKLERHYANLVASCACPYCDVKFSRMPNLRIHIGKHADLNAALTFTCMHCNREFNHFTNYSVHHRMHKKIDIRKCCVYACQQRFQENEKLHNAAIEALERTTFSAVNMDQTDELVFDQDDLFEESGESPT